jgi:hypothetical protein
MSILRRRRGVHVLILLWLLFPSPSSVHAAEATLSEIIVSNTQDDLLVFFEIRGCFTREMEEAILNGIPTTFTVFIKLYRTRSFWLDSAIASFKVEHNIKYDSMKKEFRVRRSEDGNRELVLKDFAAAKQTMAQIRNVKVVPLSSLRKDSTYQLQVKAELEKVRLPLHLHYVLFFVSLWDFETDWYTVDFTY